MVTRFVSKFANELDELMFDFGYDYNAKRGTLTSKGIRGFTSDRVLPYHFRSELSAAEYLRPIIKDEVYSERLSKICQDAETNAADIASSKKYSF